MATAEMTVDANVCFTYDNKPRMGKVVKAEPAKGYVKVELVEGVVKTFTINKMKDLITNPPCDIKLLP